MIIYGRAKRTVMVMFALNFCCFAVWVISKQLLFSMESSWVGVGDRPSELISKIHRLNMVRSISGFASFASVWCTVAVVAYYKLRYRDEGQKV